jgi:hypothetical protein
MTVTFFPWSACRSNILGSLAVVRLPSRTIYKFPLLWVFFQIFFLLLDNVIEFYLQIFEPFLVCIGKRRGGGEFFDFFLEVCGTMS